MNFEDRIITLRNSKDDEPAWLSNAIKSRIRNASQLPKIYYAMHFSEGVAEYREYGQKPFRVLINESTAKKMDPTFPGCPVVVLHTDEDLKDILPKIMDVADGFVVESFFNEADGKHWAKFLAITDKAHEAIAKRWAVSNCYTIKDRGPGGTWHGVDFQNEVTEGKYQHLAIVPNPRYESVILTPEEFKAYNAEKKSELARLANSNNDQGESPMKKVLNIFRRQKVEKLENGAELSELVLQTKGGKQYSIAELVEEVEKLENMQGYCNMDHMVKVGEEEMSVNELVKRHMANEEEKAARKKDEEASEGDGAGADDAFSNEDGEEEAGDDVDAAGLENSGDEESPEEKKARIAKQKADAEKARKAQGKKHFNSIANAADLAALKREKAATEIETSRTELARGADRYGSANGRGGR